ncbi:YbaB/EbfC family nucleoid-associated protein [Actinoplanes sp. NPDC051859]|uniref:YbaB/EbfC family nucleoid-associated protein n=1 Tax=Actinoplanes sp. NPDC051859 TaxID=3363909 RepID=UPI0037BC1999
MPPNPEDDLRSFELRANAQLQRTLQLSAELEAAEVMVQSPNGEVTVRVNSAGGLADLVFHPESDRLVRDDLARLVLTTSRRAQAKLAERVSEITTSMYGASSSTAAFLSEAYTSRYPQPDDDDPETR